ncbi:MAG TPA: hypothetical protein VHB45_14285 [Alloacidobacterium sp.]|nr:hypothetical protein [Alloacidobacterium sp.]
MNRQLKLEKRIKTCCICGQVERFNETDAKRPNIMAISPLLCRRGQGKSAIKNAGAVNVCEECFIATMLRTPSQNNNLWAALMERLKACYSAMVEASEG